MIVLLDIDNKCINLYNEDGINKISFYNIEEIYDYIALNQKVYYVTNAIETNVDDLIKVVSSITGKETISSSNSNIRYLHSTCTGPLNIPDPNSKPEEDIPIMSFNNSYDLKILDTFLEDKIKQYPVILNAIKRGKIEIINEIQKNKILAKKRKVEKESIKKQKLKDAKLDKVLSSKDMKARDLAENMFEDDNDDEENITLNITDSNIDFKTEMEIINSKIGKK